MRILLALLSCLILPSQLVLGGDEPAVSPVAVEQQGSTAVFQNYEEALQHAEEQGVPLIIVLLSDNHTPVLDAIAESGFDLGEHFGVPFGDMAAIVVIHPKDGGDSREVDNFKNNFPETQFPDCSGICMVTVLVGEDHQTVLDAVELAL
ncbi:hypothetical protein [Chlamydia vaughanii]|uniref:hypothetical protein n=1 Tax=Chlamydia vaughanii TaxID=3112552 RepID=UPI0032B16052